MPAIWTIGEMLVEIMRPDVDIPHKKPDYYRGPFPSGAPAIFIDCAARLGASTGVIGCVGDDEFGELMKERFARDAVNTDYLTTSPSTSTGCAFVSYSSDGSRKFIFHIGNSAAGEVKAPAPVAAEGAKYLHVCGCSLSASPTMGNEILSTVRMFRASGAKVSFDPNIRPELMRDDSSLAIIREVLSNTSVLLPGVAELLLISGCDSIESAAEKLFRNPVLEVIAIKDGKRGCRILSRTEDFKKGIYPIELLDATGAGDNFDAGFVVSLLEGRSLNSAAEWATAASAYGINGFGPMEGKIRRDLIEQMIIDNEGHR